MSVRRADGVSFQAPAEAAAEADLVLASDLRVIQVVVAVRVQHAVGEDRRRHLHRTAEENLQSAGGPGVAAGLQDVGHAHRGVKPPRLAGQCGPDSRESAAEQQFQVPVLHPKPGLGEADKGAGEALAHAIAVAPGARQPLNFGFHTAQEPRQLLLAGSLLVAR